MIKRADLKNKIGCFKIRTKLTLLILISGILCVLLFRSLWNKKYEVWYFLSDNLPKQQTLFPKPADDFWKTLTTEALHYNVPESENDEKAQEAIEPFFSFADEYTSLYIYGLEDGLYRAGKIPEKIADANFPVFFQLGYLWTDGAGVQFYEHPVQFKNGYASVFIYFYHSSFFMHPYFIFCLLLSVCLFFFIILFFVGRKMRIIVRLEKSILQMSSGDLLTPVPNAGRDELGILSLELNNLRNTLHENIVHEQKIHTSSQELIAALSHDLRTPLTILKGYLEIIYRNQNPQTQIEYISRCMQKTEEIHEMTDRMFEYALVYHETSADSMKQNPANLSLGFFMDTLKEHADFLNLAGFKTIFSPENFLPESIPSGESFCITADAAMIKRVFNNLFSNIIKYGDKKETVAISVSLDINLHIILKNFIKTDLCDIESTQIGLKSAKKIMQQMNGSLTLQTKEGFFTAELFFSSGIYY